MPKLPTFKVALVGGGSGGHIYPLVAVTRTLRRYLQDNGAYLDARYFGSAGNYDAYLEREGVKVLHVATSKMRRYFSIQNFFDVFKFFYGFFEALTKLYFFMPDVLFSKGGAGAYGTILAARWYRIPVVIHESDAVAGITNRQSAKHAVMVDLAFEEAKKYFSIKANTKVVGLPVRKTIALKENPNTSRLEFGFSSQLPTIFLVGGSQGANALNEFVLENPEILLKNFHIIHQTGENNHKDYKAQFDFVTKNFKKEIKQNYYSAAYLNDHQMAAALNAADLVVSRAGSSIWEIASVGKPSILIPIPASANDHQRANAYSYAKAGAAVVIEEENLRGNIFLTQVNKILSDQNKLAEMSEAAKKFFRPESAELIAADLLDASNISNQILGAEK